MPDEMDAANKAAVSINTLVITHGNGDRYYGSELLKGVVIIATKTCAEEMMKTLPGDDGPAPENGSGNGTCRKFCVKVFRAF